jgi:hypothetical protein
MATLFGTGTTFDQDYYVDHVDAHYNDKKGFLMTARFKNATVDSQATV